MIIRLAKQEDFEKVIEIDKLSFADPWDTEFLERLSKDIFLVFEDQDIYGFLIAGCCYKNTSATILKIAVHPNHRRKGIAANLLLKMLDILSDRHIDEVDVIVSENFRPAICLYRKFGFKVTSTIPLTSENDYFCVLRLPIALALSTGNIC